MYTFNPFILTLFAAIHRLTAIADSYVLGALGYAIGAAVLPATSVGKDHATPRIYFVGHADGQGEPGFKVNWKVAGVQRDRGSPGSLVRANGISPRMAQLCAAGNAIVPQVAAEFIKAAMTDA